MLMIPTWVAAMTDLGTVGDVYPVAEADVREELKLRVQDGWEQDGWEQKKDEYQKTVDTYQPVDLYQLPRAKQDRTFLVDMSYTLDRDLRDREGRVLYPRGYTFNPLDYMRLSIGLVVIDGSDPAQVKWFRESPYSEDHRVKLLISGGYAHELITALKRAVFYLGKDVAERLQLAAVPCVAIQRGGQMQVTEFLIGEGR
ncbi:conjugal transfer pilus assembly protein TraW [Desulfopila aestuarii DSM 18488]|uniref:Conjugal transfer pilus assembly protein TraW n=2 Tax=Desulfopila aestuarii TaxID=231440 RepID=A0A1M7YHD8_9BACT|nr:conjugal transfer pilus assembly protein TraW [Desulfopila aestuarii DSM 18488]